MLNFIISKMIKFDFLMNKYWYVIIKIIIVTHLL